MVCRVVGHGRGFRLNGDVVELVFSYEDDGACERLIVSGLDHDEDGL